MGRKKIIYLIIFLSLICLIFSVKVNINTYQDYMQSTGKTRALFGLSELKFSYRYYLGILSLIGFIISANYLRKKENPILLSIAMLISMLATSISFFRIWRIFI
jgi:hypothetical protein